MAPGSHYTPVRSFRSPHLKMCIRGQCRPVLGLHGNTKRNRSKPAQLKAILDSLAPGSRKGVQQLTGRLAALGQFLSRFIDSLKPFFATLRGVNRAGWNEECDQALVTIKHYLAEPPELASPEVGETLFIYLAV